MSEKEILNLEEEPVSNVKMLMAMGGIGLIAGVLIVFAFQFTLPYVKANEAAYLEQSIFDVMTGSTKKEAFTINDRGKLIPVTDEEGTAFKLYACYNDNDSLIGVAIEARDQGFQDVIRLIYGYSPAKQSIVGMKVLQSTETPGLGDKIQSDPDFLANFDHLSVALKADLGSLKKPITLVKGQKSDDSQISAITGATISSRAVTKMIARSAELNIPVIAKNIDVLKKDKK